MAKQPTRLQVLRRFLFFSAAVVVASTAIFMITAYRLVPQPSSFKAPSARENDAEVTIDTLSLVQQVLTFPS